MCDMRAWADVSLTTRPSITVAICNCIVLDVQGVYIVGYIWPITKWEASQAICKGSIEKLLGIVANVDIIQKMIKDKGLIDRYAHLVALAQHEELKTDESTFCCLFMMMQILYW